MSSLTSLDVAAIFHCFRVVELHINSTRNAVLLTSGGSLRAESEDSDNESDGELHDCQKVKDDDFLAGIEVRYIAFRSLTVGNAGRNLIMQPQVKKFFGNEPDPL